MLKRFILDCLGLKDVRPKKDIIVNSDGTMEYRNSKVFFDKVNKTRQKQRKEQLEFLDWSYKGKK